MIPALHCCATMIEFLIGTTTYYSRYHQQQEMKIMLDTHNIPDTEQEVEGHDLNLVNSFMKILSQLR